jgi:polar amino acid transport system substrate-binding protein
VRENRGTEGGSGAEIVRFEDDATLITAAVSGQVDLVSTQEAVVGVMNEKRPDRPFKTKFVQSELNLGIALPQGDDPLKDWLNAWVRTAMQSGRLNAMFRTFHGRDLPADLVERS